VAVRKEGKMILGRTQGNFEAVRSIKDGLIADFEINQAMLLEFINKAHNPRTLVRHRIIVWGNCYVLYI
jgi:rod shape-determining protein MreB